ncbi:MAG TPA: hypothetical protein VFD46_08650 [Chryseolinea sp.]|nr:hypothetical protein [Chryseolinea sp.]
MREPTTIMNIVDDHNSDDNTWTKKSKIVIVLVLAHHFVRENPR